MPTRTFEEMGITKSFYVVELRKEEKETILQAIRQIVKEEISLALERKRDKRNLLFGKG